MGKRIEAQARYGPMILMSAPNGARKTKADHPALPITPDEVARVAAEVMEAGANSIHLHVRDAEEKHSLDHDRYKQTLAAIKRECGDGIVAQVTSEAVGIYTPAEQRAMVEAVRPEAVSMAVRELVPDESEEQNAHTFFAWCSKEQIGVQFILYTAADVVRFQELCGRGVIPQKRPFVLYVLGRYAADQRSSPADLLPFLVADQRFDPWAFCAFGEKETACAAVVASLGGHCRIGFENNVYNADGSVAADNAARIAEVAACAQSLGRPIGSADQVREILTPTL